MLIHSIISMMNKPLPPPVGAAGGNVTWRDILNAVTTAPNIYKPAAGFSRATSVETISSASASFFSWHGRAGVSGSGIGTGTFFLRLASGRPYLQNIQPAGLMPRLLELRGSGPDVYIYDAANAFVAGINGLSNTEIIKVGFVSGKPTVWRGAAQVYQGAAIPVDDYVLYFSEIYNNSGGGADEVLYQG